MSESIANLPNDVPATEITKENATQNPVSKIWDFKDEAALKLVVDDTTICDNYLNILQWASGWTQSDMIYQSPQGASAFDGGNIGQANVPKFTVSNHISAIVPKMMNGIFYEDPPFLLRPRPNVTPDIVRAKTTLMAYQLDDMCFEPEVERALEQQALLGTMIMKWGYEEYSEKRKDYVRLGQQKTIATALGPIKVDTALSDAYKVEWVDHTVSRPWIRMCDIRAVLVDPGCRVGDIRHAKFVVYRDYATWDDIERLRSNPEYTIPSVDQLQSAFLSPVAPPPDNITMTLPEGMMGYLQHAVPRSRKTSADPYQNGLEILERWDKDKVIVVLRIRDHNILIRNSENPYGCIPFYSANWRNIPDCFYGQGLGLLIGPEQLVEQGVTNLALDLLAYGLQPTALRKKGFNAPSQQLMFDQGGIIDVDDDVEKAFKFLEMPAVPGEAWQFIAQSKADSASTSGANEQVMQGAGAMGVHSTGMRSGTGAAAVIAANATRLDGPVGRFIRQVFEPWLFQMNQLNNDLLPTSVMREVLGEQMGDDYQMPDHIKIRKAKIEFEVLAGASLGPKKEMAQFLPIVMQLINNPTFSANINDAGYTWDGLAILRAFTDFAGFKYTNNFIKKMSPQQQQMHVANSPAAMQARQLQAQQQAQLAQFQHEEQIEDAKQLGKAGNEVLRQSVEQNLTPQEVQGQTSNAGFGSTTAI
jgi:hypothetical protein